MNVATSCWLLKRHWSPLIPKLSIPSYDTTIELGPAWCSYMKSWRCPFHQVSIHPLTGIRAERHERHHVLHPRSANVDRLLISQYVRVVHRERRLLRRPQKLVQVPHRHRRKDQVDVRPHVLGPVQRALRLRVEHCYPLRQRQRLVRTSHPPSSPGRRKLRRKNFGSA